MHYNTTLHLQHLSPERDHYGTKAPSLGLLCGYTYFAFP